jgi:hypothetical protein
MGNVLCKGCFAPDVEGSNSNGSEATAIAEASNIARMADEIAAAINARRAAADAARAARARRFAPAPAHASEFRAFGTYDEEEDDEVQ